MRRRARAIHEIATETAGPMDGVISLARLRDVGINGEDVASQVRARRWRRHGRQTVAVHTGDLTDRARRWRAVWEVGEGIAVIDGVTALQEAGMKHFDDDFVHVSVPHNANTTPVPWVVIHKVRRREERHVRRGGLPTARPAPAAIRAAHWARSDRQAALLMVMPVQQRLCSGEELVVTAREVRGRTRRAFIKSVASDVALGAQALGELDFARVCRAYGMPEPSRQVVRRGRRGRSYLDARWDCGLVVEIDGVGHQWDSR